MPDKEQEAFSRTQKAIKRARALRELRKREAAEEAAAVLERVAKENDKKAKEAGW